MDPVANPYRPGAGRRPPILAGREQLLAGYEVIQRKAVERGEGDRGWILNGLRGVGKTVLLTELLDRASTAGWIAAKAEVGAEPLPISLSRSLVRAMRTATGRHPENRLKRLLSVFKAFSLRIEPSGALALGVDVDPLAGIADSGRFGDDLSSLFEILGETARDLGIGVLILIDELQEAAPQELAAINMAVHSLGQADPPLPLTFVGAGLPSLPAQLAEATSYAERLYDYRPVGLLDDDGSKDALVLPSLHLDVDWDDDALQMALASAHGYPYFLQAVGKHVWDHARRSPISPDDVEVGLVEAQREVDEGLYRSRWERATPLQRDLMRTLAELGGDGSAPISDIAAAMGRSRTSDISVPRQELIKKGLAYAPDRGLLAFTVPGMHDFIGRQP